MGRKKNGRRPNIAAGARAHAQQKRQQSMDESFAKMNELERLSLQGQKGAIRAVLMRIGTDCDKNDANPTGDGDQSMFPTRVKGDKAREIYSIGGDIHKHLTDGAFSPFAFSCIVGEPLGVKQRIDDTTSCISKPWCRSEEMKKILETRESSLRLSPLLLIVSAGKNASFPGNMSRHEEVAKMLLKYGASPLAKDVLGKTVCHYGAGAMATPMTLKVVDMCIRAARTAYLYTKDVKLHGLKKEEMNGLSGIAGGFDPDSGRRVVHLSETGREVWVKPENICLLVPDAVLKGKKNLTDVQDRLGSVSLHEVVIQDRKDVAEFLLREHNTSIHTKDMNGTSPLMMSTMGGIMISDVSKLINQMSIEEGNRARKIKKLKICCYCQKDLGVNGGSTCSRCMSAEYCSRVCQKSHWKAGHKQECMELSTLENGVKIDRPTGDYAHTSTISMVSGRAHTRGTYCKPTGIKVNERFVVKIQAMGEMAPIMVYDKSRSCEFCINPGRNGFHEIVNETQKEMTWGGKKTFMKASFDEAGNCTIYPKTAGVRKQYTW